MRLLRAIDAFWYAPAPAERLAVLRVLVGAYALVYLLVRYLSLTTITRFHASEFAPVGPVELLAAPLSPWLVHALVLLAIVSGAAFVFGARYRVSAPLFALTFLWVTSYRSSWGMKFHTENLVCFHLLLLAFAPAADALSWDAKRERTTAGPAHGRYGWAIRAMCVVTVVTYVLAGVAKLRIAGFEWADGALLRTQVAYDNLRKIELGSLYSPLGAALVAYPAPFRLLAALSLALELGAPIALLGPRSARLWVVGAFSFHLGVLALMAIAFPYPLSFIAYASFFRVEQLRDTRAYAWLARRFAP